MKHGNLLAASLTAATFVVLALLPLTRGDLRFDMQMAAGRRVLGTTLTDLGVRQEALPFSGIGSPTPERPGVAQTPSSEFPVRLADAMHLPGREKWAALQRLAADFPDNPAGHAAVARMACKNGGSVDVGHGEEQAELSPRVTPVQKNTPNPSNPMDVAIMLRSCQSGERLDPENAYFPAMAAVAHLAANEDSAAYSALRRAAEKPFWREYIEVEAEGRLRRSELLTGSQSSLTQAATLASILFPHYAALRSMARVTTVQAMRREQAGDVKSGLTLRRDVARIGEKMREQSSSLIGGLVGIAIIRVTELRPGGAPLVPSDVEDGEVRRQKVRDQFLAYLAANSGQADVARWQRYDIAATETKTLARQGVYVSIFGLQMLFESQAKLLSNLALLSAAVLVSILGGFALLQPWLNQRVGRAASIVAVTGFLALLAWGTWQAWNNVRDITAFTSVMQGLSGDDESNRSAAEQALANAEKTAIASTVFTEGVICVVALLTWPVYLCVVAFLARRNRVPMGEILRRWTLPLACLLTLGYALRLTAFSLRERVVRAELQQVVTHEGRYVAEKLGKVWPTTGE